MFSRIARRQFSSSAVQNYKVTVLGAGGGIGQPLSLLLKLNHKVTKLSLYDLKGAKGVATDLSHIPTNSTVEGFGSEEADGLQKALQGSDVVLIPAGVPRKPGMTRDDLFAINAGIVRDLATAVAENAPDAAVLVIANPVNSTVPIVAETFKKHGVYNPKKIFGVTTLDVLRASRFLSEIVGTDPTSEKVTVVGGHSGFTIVPLLSQSKHKDLKDDVRDALVKRIQFGGDEVVKAKNGAGSATLSMAQAGARFANSVLSGLEGEKDIIEPSYVDNPIFAKEGISHFSTNITLGTSGAEKIHGLGEISSYEQDLIDKAKDTLKKSIDKGVAFVDSK